MTAISLEPNLSLSAQELTNVANNAGGGGVSIESDNFQQQVASRLSDELSLLRLSLCATRHYQQSFELSSASEMSLKLLRTTLEQQQQQQHQHHQHHHQTQHQTEYFQSNHLQLHQLQLEQQLQLQLQQQVEQHCSLAACATVTGESVGHRLPKLPLTSLALDYLVKPAQSLDKTLDYYFSEFWSENGDERAIKLPFMSGGPWKLLYATLIYLYLIKWLLPKLMRNQRPFELNWCIRVYNLLMVLSNMYAFYHGVRILELGTKSFGCEVINHRDYSPKAIELLHYGWLFLMSRLIEWLDTIFFVLRKKENQVTKLHVFHHSFVPLICWTYLKFHPGYTVAFFPFVNTFVHTIMYTYYLLATFGPKIQPYLWWKKYLTSLQILQFIIILIQLATIPLSTNEKCQYPRGFLYVAFAGAILFLWLFYTYYIDTYKSSSAKSSISVSKSLFSFSSPLPSCLSSSSSKLIQSNKVVNDMNYPKLNKSSSQAREGSSRSISDAIDNAIFPYEDQACNLQCTSTIKSTNERNKKGLKID